MNYTLKITKSTPIYFLIIGMFLIQISMPFEISSVSSIGTWLIILSSLFAFFIAILHKRYLELDKFLVLLLMVSVTVSLLCSLQTSYSSIVSAGCFLEIPLFLCSYRITRNKNTIKFIYICFILLSVYYIIMSLTPLAYRYETQYGIVQLPSLTLNYNNPNETALYLFYCSIVIVSLFLRVDNRIYKVFLLIDYVLLLTLIILTQSRTCILASIFFIVFLLVFRKKRIPGYFRILMLSIPLLYITITLLFDKLLSNIYILDEVFETGRYEIFMRVFGDYNLFKFLIGEYGYHFQNLHNSYIAILATIGIIGFGLFITFLNIKLKEVQAGIRNYKTENVYLIGLYGIILVSATEAASLCAGSAFAASVISIYLLAVNHEETPIAS